jgi:hypothetical protein
MWSETSYEPSHHQYKSQPDQKQYQNLLTNADLTGYVTKQRRLLDKMNYTKSAAGIHTNTNLSIKVCRVVSTHKVQELL